MKTFLSSFAACMLAAALVLLAYDVLVAQPRERALQASLQAVLDSPGEDHVARRLEQAAQVADALDASVDRSIANARDAMAREAAIADTRGRIAEGLTRAAGFKLAVAETYMTQGSWPLQAADAGLAAPDMYAVGAVSAIALEQDGVVVIRYNATIAPEAQIRLIPRARADIGSVDWRCEASGFPDKSLLPATCR